MAPQLPTPEEEVKKVEEVKEEDEIKESWEDEDDLKDSWDAEEDEKESTPESGISFLSSWRLDVVKPGREVWTRMWGSYL